jgi:hypothetical protein
MAAAPEKLAALRRQLAERFPTTRHQPGRRLRTGVPALDETTGGLPLAALTELVCDAPSCGSHLLLSQFLAITRAGRTRVALIDAADSLDPESLPADSLTHLVWVRCPRHGEAAGKATTLALNAADLVARDANFGLVILDLHRAPELDLRRIPGSQWYRLQRAVEPTDLALVVITPRASVPSAQLRLVLGTAQEPAAFTSDRPALVARLAPAVQRQRLVHETAAG